MYLRELLAGILWDIGFVVGLEKLGIPRPSTDSESLGFGLLFCGCGDVLGRYAKHVVLISLEGLRAYGTNDARDRVQLKPIFPTYR